MFFSLENIDGSVYGTSIVFESVFFNFYFLGFLSMPIFISAYCNYVYCTDYICFF